MRFGIALLLLLLISLTAHAEERVALVVGNGAYPVHVGELANPANDAVLMADTLRDLGFDVIEVIDGQEKTMKRAIRNFGKKLNDAGKDGVGLFYYAGHGIQVKGTNYLIPVDAEIDTEGDVDLSAITVNSVLSMMEFSQARLSFIILDACRNNPFARGFRSATRGLARMDAPQGSLVAYATAPGDVAADGNGQNSPYTEALVKGLKSKLPVEQMFREVRNSVMQQTGKRQTPWESSSLTGDNFYFNPLALSQAEPTPVVQQPVVQPAPAVQPQMIMTPDMLAWQTIQNSGNPAELEQFIVAFPQSPFVGIAKARLQSLSPPPVEKEKVVVAPTPAVKDETPTTLPVEQVVASLAPATERPLKASLILPEPKISGATRTRTECSALDIPLSTLSGEVECFAYEGGRVDGRTFEVTYAGTDGTYGVLLTKEKNSRPLYQVEELTNREQGDRLRWIGAEAMDTSDGEQYEISTRYDDEAIMTGFSVDGTPMRSCFHGLHGFAFKNEKRKNADHSGYRRIHDLTLCEMGRTSALTKGEMTEYLTGLLPE